MDLSFSGCAMIQLAMIFAPPTGMSVVAAFATVSTPEQAASTAAVAAVASAAPRSRLRREQENWPAPVAEAEVGWGFENCELIAPLWARHDPKSTSCPWRGSRSLRGMERPSSCGMIAKAD